MTSTIEVSRQQRLAQIKQHLHHLQADAARTLWAFGRALIEVRDEQLFLEDGAERLSQWIEESMGLSWPTAQKAMMVAEHFNAEMAERYGTEKLSATVRYLRVTKQEEQPGDALALNFRVRQGSGFASVPFADASYRQIDEARQLVETSRAGRRKPPKALINRAKRLESVMPRAPRGLRTTNRVRLSTSADGRVAVTFAAIPLDELEAFLDAAREHLLNPKAG